VQRMQRKPWLGPRFCVPGDGLRSLTALCSAIRLNPGGRRGFRRGLTTREGMGRAKRVECNRLAGTSDEAGRQRHSRKSSHRAKRKAVLKHTQSKRWRDLVSTAPDLAKRVECDRLAGAFEWPARICQAKAGASSTRSIRFASIGCGCAPCVSVVFSAVSICIDAA